MTNDYSTLNTSGSNYVQLMGKQYLVTTATTFNDDPVWRVIITETLQEQFERTPRDQMREGGHPHREPNVRRSYAMTVHPDGRWVIDVRQYGLLSGWLEQMCATEMGTIRWHYIVENANRPRLAPGSGLIPSSHTSFNNSFITEITADDRGFSVVFIQSHQPTAPYVPTIFGSDTDGTPFHPAQIPAPVMPTWGGRGERRKCQILPGSAGLGERQLAQECQIRFDKETDIFTVEFH